MTGRIRLALHGTARRRLRHPFASRSLVLGAALIALMCAAPAGAQAATAAFTTSPSTALAGQPITFDASSSQTQGTASYSWAFGDGSTATGVSVQHTYAGSTEYMATLTVSDENGTTGTAEMIRVYPGFTYSPYGDSLPGQEVTFDASSFDAAPGARYSWDFGDGSTGTGVSAQHAYSTAGVFSVALTISNAPGRLSVNEPITVSALRAPQVWFSPSGFPELDPGQSLSFHDSSSSSNSGGRLVAWSWYFGDGSTSDQEDPTHIYTTPGTYTATETVTDNYGSTASGSVQVTVETLPTLSFTVTASCGRVSDCPLMAGQPSWFKESCAACASFQWDFGDGTTLSSSTPNSWDPQHAYPKAGAYRVTLSGVDIAGTPLTYTATENVVAPPDATFAFTPASPEAHQAVSFIDTSTSGTRGDTITQVNLTAQQGTNPYAPFPVETIPVQGNSGYAGGARFVYVFDHAGTYTVRQEVNESNGANSYSSQVIVVKPASAPTPAPTPTPTPTRQPARLVLGQMSHKVGALTLNVSSPDGAGRLSATAQSGKDKRAMRVKAAPGGYTVSAKVPSGTWTLVLTFTPSRGSRYRAGTRTVRVRVS